MDSLPNSTGPFPGFPPVIQAARQCAIEAGHRKISGLHLLLGLLTTCPKLFQSLGVETAALQARLREHLPPADGRAPSHMFFSESAGRAFATATNEAGECEGQVIRVEHLLLGLLGECSSAWEKAHGVPIDELAILIRERIKNHSGKSTKTTTPTDRSYTEAQKAVGMAFAAARSRTEPVDVVHLIEAVLEIDSAAVQGTLVDLGLTAAQVRGRLANTEVEPVPDGSRNLTARAREALDSAELHASQAGREVVEIGDLLRAAWAVLAP